MVHNDVSGSAQRLLHGLAAAICGLALASPTLPSPLPNDPLAAVRPERLRQGDIVFSSGRGWRADAVRVAGRSPWSHVGLLVGDARTGWSVVHAAPPEGDSKGGVVATPLAQFAAPANSARIAFYRYARSDKADGAAVAIIAGRMAAASVPFDGRFDLTSDRALYCTELALRAYREAGMDLGAVPSRVSIGGLSASILLPEDLLATGKLVGTN
jgi:hypothetical protein